MIHDTWWVATLGHVRAQERQRGLLVTMVGHDVASVPQPARVRGAPAPGAPSRSERSGSTMTEPLAPGVTPDVALGGLPTSLTEGVDLGALSRWPLPAEEGRQAHDAADDGHPPREVLRGDALRRVPHLRQRDRRRQPTRLFLLLRD